MALTQEQIRDYASLLNRNKKKAGQSDDPLLQRLQKKVEENQPRESFFSRVKKSVLARKRGVEETFRETAMGEITPVETGVRTVGDVIGGVYDVLGEAISPVTEPVMEKIAETKTGNAALSALASGIDKYNDWKTSSPENERFAESLEAILNIGSILPIGGGAKVGVQTGKKAARIGKEIGEEAVVKGAALTKGAGRTGAEVLGFTTGAGAAPFKEAFVNPNVIKFARQAGKEGPEKILDEALMASQKGLRNIKNKRSLDYKKGLSELELKKDIKPVLQSTKRKLSSLEDDLDVIVEGKNVVEKAIDDVKTWSDTSVEGMDKLKKRLSSYESQLKQPGKANAKRIVGELKDEVRGGLNKNVAGYEELTAGWRDASNLIDDINSALSVKDVTQKETAVRKLMQTMKRDDDTRKALVEALEMGSDTDITAMIAGALVGRATPRGLAGRIGAMVGGGIGVGAVLNPSFFVALLPALPFLSPRVAAEFVNILGKISRKMIKVNKFSPEMAPEIRAFLETVQKESIK